MLSFLFPKTFPTLLLCCNTEVWHLFPAYVLSYSCTWKLPYVLCNMLCSYQYRWINVLPLNKPEGKSAGVGGGGGWMGSGLMEGGRGREEESISGQNNLKDVLKCEQERRAETLWRSHRHNSTASTKPVVFQLSFLYLFSQAVDCLTLSFFINFEIVKDPETWLKLIMNFI